MIKKGLYGVLIFFMACQSLEPVEKPKNLIPEDQMIVILTDIAFLKAAKSSYKKTFDKDKINPEAYILQKYEIDSLRFAENNKWYTSQIEQYREIFTKVRSNLDASKKEYEKLKQQEDSLKMIVQDSIKNNKELKAGEKKLTIPKKVLSKFEGEKESIKESVTKADKKKFKKIAPLEKKKKSQ